MGVGGRDPGGQQEARKRQFLQRVDVHREVLIFEIGISSPSAFQAASWRAQPSGLKTRRVDGGYCASFAAGRIGRGERLPPQLGHTPSSTRSAQPAQKVHSNVQIIASLASGGRSLPQHSQFGRSSSMPFS
jgi:hypothetical protein